jgi:hypothetical protein
MKFVFLFLSFLVIYCDDSGDVSPQEAEKAIIDKLNVEIKGLAKESVCSEEFICYSVGIGAKPCGGFWEYIVYSSSIDVVSFLTKIETMNELEKEYNEKYMILSDCFLAMPPSSLTCENGKCVGIFE